MRFLPTTKVRLLLAIPFIVCWCISGCKAPPAEYPVLNEKLSQLSLHATDLKVVDERAHNYPVLPFITTALQAPLTTPDYVQHISEEVLRAQEKQCTIPAALCAQIYGAGTPPHSPIRPVQLRHVLARLRRQYKSPLQYDTVLTWAKTQPPVVTDSLAVLLDALMRAHRYRQLAFHHLNENEQEQLKNSIPRIAGHVIGEENTYPFDEHFLPLFKKVDMPFLIAAAETLSDAAAYVSQRLQSLKTVPALRTSFSFSTPLGTVIIGSTGHDMYDTTACLIIDFAGNDTYCGTSGVAPVPGSVQLLFDYSGNDVYTTENDYAFASAVMGASLLYDYSGHDFYSARDYSLGCGILGAGILIDEFGDDEFKARHCTTGAGVAGIGIVINKKGNDYYSAKHYAQAFSMVYGIGMLIDIYGNDFYSAGGDYPGWAWSEESYESSSQGFSMGIREYAGGGIAYLLDASGNDSYHGSALCQGAGYWYGIGILHDLMGNDFYTALHYAQGSGVHLGMGLLLDNEGNDFYKSTATSQGSGYHEAAGMLIDYAGNDYYTAKKLSCGAGSLVGLGLCDDKAGDDTYCVDTQDTSLGAATRDDDIPSLGFFFDEGGDDFYLYSRSFKDSNLKTSMCSLRSDGTTPLDICTKTSFFLPITEKPASYYHEVSLPDAKDPERIEKLYTILMDERAFRTTRLHAAAAFMEDPEKAADFLIDCIRSPSISRSLTFPAAYISRLDKQITPRLIEEIPREKNDYIRAKYILYLQYSREKELVIPFLRARLAHERGRSSRIALITILTRLQDRKAVPLIAESLSDKDPFIVLRALEAIKSMHYTPAIPTVTHLLFHHTYFIRDFAAQTILSLGDKAMEYIRDRLQDASPAERPVFEQLIERHKQKFRQ